MYIQFWSNNVGYIALNIQYSNGRYVMLTIEQGFTVLLKLVMQQ